LGVTLGRAGKGRVKKGHQLCRRCSPRAIETSRAHRRLAITSSATGLVPRNIGRRATRTSIDLEIRLSQLGQGCAFTCRPVSPEAFPGTRSRCCGVIGQVASRIPSGPDRVRHHPRSHCPRPPVAPTASRSRCHQWCGFEASLGRGRVTPSWPCWPVGGTTPTRSRGGEGPRG
jgi:hypothetical protein